MILAKPAIGYTKDGRLRWATPCAYGHAVQAMECPPCGEKQGFPATSEAVKWYERRYPKHRRPASASQWEEGHD